LRRSIWRAIHRPISPRFLGGADVARQAIPFRLRFLRLGFEGAPLAVKR